MNSIFRTGVTGFNLDNFVPAPEPDTFSRGGLDTGYYTIHFKWFDVTDPDPKELPISAKFGPGRRYRAELTIISNPSFSFEDPAVDAKRFTWGVMENSPNKGKGHIESAVPAGMDTIKITIDFEKTGKIKINLLNFYGITAPANGGTPTASLADKTGYKITEIKWFDADNALFNGKFEAEKDYTAKVKVKADLKYTFEGLDKSGIFHTGKDVSLDPEIPPEDCNTLTVTIEFFPADITGISHIDLKAIPGPVAGENADTDYTAPKDAGYDVTAVEWSKNGVDYNLEPGFQFEMGQKYWSRITVTPHEGYEFANLDNLKNWGVTHNGEKVTIASADDGKGSIYIIVEYDAITALVTVVDLTKISAPDIGKVPVRELDTSKLPFTVESITWQPADALFEAKPYKAVVELETKAGYFFDDLESSGIICDGGWVKMEPDPPGPGTTSITVTINFDPPVPETNQDGDDDGLTDTEEALHGTDPEDSDTDNDGFSDGWEVVNDHDPKDDEDPGRDGDVDGDGFPNGWELDNGHDPTDNTDPDPDGDEDNDGFPNGWEADNGYDPLNPGDPDPDGDDDGDGLTNKKEFEEGTDPKDLDTDDDGFPDGWEVDNGYGPLNPNDPNPNGDDDGDGFTNREEYENETNPHVSSTKAITAFSITAPVTAAGVINQAAKTITVTVPHGTAVTTITASATHTGKSISPTPGTGRDYTSSVSYTVTAEDDTTQAYTVTVQVGAVPKSSAADITGFSIPEQTGTAVINNTANTISLTVPYGTNRTSLSPTISVSAGATVSPTSGTARNFTTPQTYTVTAENGTTTKAYTVTVQVGAAPKSSEADITGFTINGVNATISGTSVSVTVPYGTNLTTLSPTISVSAGATVSPASGTARDFTTSQTYTVTAENGTTTKTYTVTVQVGAAPKSSAADITDFTINGVNATISGTSVSLTVPYGTSLTSLSPTITVSAGATVSPTSGTARNFTTSQTYTVTAENRTTTKTYTVTVNLAERTADSDGDGFPDGWEVDNGYDPLDPNDPAPNGDDDDDGLTNQEEFDHGTDPRDQDTDGDGFPDGWEVVNGYDPLDENGPAPNGDDDGDGLTNQEEFDHHTDPHDQDTDNDGFPDGWEVVNDYDPLDENAPAPNGDDDGDAFMIGINSGSDSSFILPIKPDSINNLTIDWGDGSPVQTVTTAPSTGWTRTGIPHTYPAANTNYYISMYGTSVMENDWNNGICGFGFSADSWGYNIASNKAKIRSINSDILSLLPPGTPIGDSFLREAFTGCTGLAGISVDFLSGITGPQGSNFLYGTFFGCTSLSNIPNGFLSGVTGSQGMYFLSSCFMRSGLTNIPGAFLSGVTGQQGTYFLDSAFKECASLITVLDGFLNGLSGRQGQSFLYGTFKDCNVLRMIPATFLKGITGPQDQLFMHDAFSGCTILMTASPVNDSGAKLYDRVSGNSNIGRTCFYNCTLMTDYAAIPDTWKLAGVN